MKAASHRNLSKRLKDGGTEYFKIWAPRRTTQFFMSSASESEFEGKEIWRGFPVSINLTVRGGGKEKDSGAEILQFH